VPVSFVATHLLPVGNNYFKTNMMSEAPTFFVPAATSENEESVYASFAEMANSPVPSRNERIFSITFLHDGIEWTATVGERLHGVEKKYTRSKGKKIERTKRVSDPALVLAIFRGSPYIVVTNHEIGGNVGSGWVNPFMAGKPKSVTLFSNK
jgi:hypothetical protein